MAPVVVRVHCERPATSLPCYRAIEVCQSDVLVVLPGVQHIAEVCIATIPPDAEDITVSVQAHQVVEVDLIDCLILCSGEVEPSCRSRTVPHALLRYSSLRWPR